MSKRWALLYALCLVAVKVITDPYSGLNYDQINVYDYNQEYLEDCVTYHEPDHSYGGEESAEEPEEKPAEDTYQEPPFIPWRKLW